MATVLNGFFSFFITLHHFVVSYPLSSSLTSDIFAFLNLYKNETVPLMESTRTGADLVLHIIFGHMEANVSKKKESRKDKMHHKKLASQQLPSKLEIEEFFVRSFVHFIILYVLLCTYA